VLSKKELNLLFKHVTPYHFNQFIRFAYYSGARSGEIRRLSRVKVFSEYILVEGKSGRRAVKLASQARKILEENPEWDYTANYVQLTWRRNRKRLGLKDVRMHDLRRTFGYNLIKQGRPIYEVSKLLGHSSVVTTEKHYAPLIANEVNDFIL
jgi:integrase